MIPPKVFLGLLLVVGLMAACNQDQANPYPSDEFNFENLDPNAVYQLGGPDSDLPLEIVEIDLADSYVPVETRAPGNHVRTSGNYCWMYHPESFWTSTDIQFKANDNGNGVSGNFKVSRSWQLNGNEHTFSVRANSDCVMLSGSDAVIGAVITNVSGEPPFTIPDGARFWIKVRDNGSGPHSVLDEHVPTILLNINGNIACEFFGPDHSFWGDGMEQVGAAGDKITIEQ